MIPEQHDELMNKKGASKIVKSPAANGLCSFCNNNQQLKVFQLAHFVPLVEENYDMEIEHFQEQLEKAYKLCRKCDRVLKSTVQGQNARIFGNHIKKISNNISCKQITTHLINNKSLVLQKIDQGLFLVNTLAIVVIYLANTKIIFDYLGSYIPKEYQDVYINIIAFVGTNKVFTFTIPHLNFNFKMNCHLGCCAFGLTQIILELLWKWRLTAMKVNRLLCWIILILSASLITKPSWSYLLALQVFCFFYLLYTIFLKEEENLGCMIKGKTMRKLVKNLEYTCTDYSESASDFENISNSSTSLNLSNDLPQKNFTTATSVFNYEPSVIYNKPALDPDLNRSLNNLNLGGLNCNKAPSRATSLINFSVKRPKPVLSPPKLQHINTWVAKGFWKNPDGTVPFGQGTNLSRSSSESSGFGSQHNELPRNQFMNDDRFSIKSNFNDMRASSPYRNYLFSPGELSNSAFYPRSVISMPIQRPLSSLGFHPDLYQNRAPENWSDRVNLQTIQSFRDLSLQPMNN